MTERTDEIHIALPYSKVSINSRGRKRERTANKREKSGGNNEKLKITPFLLTGLAGRAFLAVT